MSNGLFCDFSSLTQLLPDQVRLTERTSHGRSGPFAPPPLQELRHYYEPVRQRDPRRYSAPRGSAAWSAPSCHPSERRFRAALSHVPCEGGRPAPRGFTPDTAWPINGTPARLIPGQKVT